MIFVFNSREFVVFNVNLTNNVIKLDFQIKNFLSPHAP